MRFFVGLHHPSAARHVTTPAFISVNALRKRKGAFAAGEWILDSGAFSTIFTHGDFPDAPEVYAAEVKRWSANGNLLAAVSQDYMCEPAMLERTRKSVAEHQRLTIERYDALRQCDTGGVYIMPVLQGYAPGDSVDHLRQYGPRLAQGAWVGVGSVCKRNGSVATIEAVLIAIARERPDLRLHGFGLKTTSLRSDIVRSLLFSADSMAWSFSARKNGRNANDWREAQRFADAIASAAVQRSLFRPVLDVESACQGDDRMVACRTQL